MRRKVMQGRYTLTRSEARLLRASFALRRVHSRIEAVLWRRAPRVAQRLGLVVHPTHRGLQ